MNGDARLSWPSERGRLPGFVGRVISGFVTLLGRARSSALALMRHLPAREARVDRVVRGRQRRLLGQLARTRSERSPASPAQRGRVRLRGTHGAPRFSTIRVAPEFSPRDYGVTFAALQEPAAGGKLLDLVPARLLCADLFEDLAGAWTVGPETVPRLGILLARTLSCSDVRTLSCSTA